MSTPSVSVIIPTCGRPQYLPQAVDSALGGEGAAVEVIVVPNGPDKGWKRSLARWDNDPRVRVSPIEVAHANAARNHGMTLARGAYLRFLDDDDYLYPDACRTQYENLRACGADVSSGNVDVVTNGGLVIRTWKQPDTADFVAAALGPSRMAQPCGHLYRRGALGEAQWDEKCPTRQDIEWMIGVAAAKEIHWHRHFATVGAWRQHRGKRVSLGRDPGPDALRRTAESIQRAYAELSASARLTTERREAAADGLWASLQKGLRYDYAYWIDVAHVADAYARGRRPPSAIHRLPLIRYIPPLAVETMLIPVRFAYSPVRNARGHLGSRGR